MRSLATLRLIICWLLLASSVQAQSTLAQDGIWTWFNSPVAFYDSTSDLLVFGAYPRAFQRPIIGAFNCTTRADLQYGYLEGGSSYETDDHDNPGVIKLASGKYLACFSEHNDDSVSFTSTAANSARLWNAGVTMNTAEADAYCQVMQATYNNKIYCFHRRTVTGAERPQYFRTSTDDGTTWSSSTQFLFNASQRPYFRWHRTSGTRFDFFYSNGQPNEAVNSLYHGYMTIDASTGAHAYYKSDGTLVGDDTDLPFAPADFTQVYNGTTSEGWVWDLKYINGQPTVVFAVFPSHGTDSHEYHYGRFNGTSWSTAKICDAGTTAAEDWLYSSEVNYSGGICLDPTNENIVYLSREYGATDFRVEKWTNSSGWSKTTDISGNTSSVNARPVAVDCNGTTNILWWEGTYTSYTSYDTDLRIYPAVNFRTAKAMSSTPLPALSPVGSRVFLPLTEGTGTPADLTATYTPSVTGSLTWGSTALGAYVDAFSTSNYITFNTYGSDVDGQASTRWMAVMFRSSDTTASQYLCALGSSSTTVPFWGLTINDGATGNLSYNIRNDANATRHSVATSQPVNDGNWHVAMGLSVTGGTNRNILYLDGVHVAQNTSSVGTITLDQAAVGVLFRTTATNPFLGDTMAVAMGYGSAPHPVALYDDWINGRFSGLGTDAASGSVVPLLLQLSDSRSRQQTHFDTYGVYSIAP